MRGRGRGPLYREGDMIEISHLGRIVAELLIIETRFERGNADQAISTDTQSPKLFEFPSGVEYIAEEINDFANSGEPDEGGYEEDEDGFKEQEDEPQSMAELEFQDAGIYLSLPDHYSFKDFFNHYGYDLPEDKAEQIRAQLDKFFG